MALKVGDKLNVVDGELLAGHFAVGEQVEVIDVPEDGVPIIGIPGTQEAPAGRTIRMADEIAAHFEPA